MHTWIKCDNRNDKDGNPSGGSVSGVGIGIVWQDGPLGLPGSPERKEPNGAFVENVIMACIVRLEFFQESKFACKENAEAILHLKKALHQLDCRTKDREHRKVEGTHAV